ncbi:hypothetical protein C2R22_15305 [Salinigranum rubrum]|uniref:DUF8159 domain-containing protein n=1 Tax=Salinigranum rubrum TaxID=755307 RepID=A0A2I8VLR9_9EURY|nr:hypothetical protein [Salinigranum rubrum]AUV82835.1 hypothetical protein C2R22_15305 [Salinigranum rubrum]
MSDVVDGLEGDLRSNGISVEELSVEEGVDLTYLTAFPGSRINHQEMGRACNTFLDRAEAGEWSPRRVDATVLRSEDDVLGTWHIEPEWITAYTEYRFSDEDFSERVLDTLNHRREEVQS